MHFSVLSLCPNSQKNWQNAVYTFLSILPATFNYRARGTFGPSTLNYLLNGDKWNFLHHPRLTSGGEG